MSQSKQDQKHVEIISLSDSEDEEPQIVEMKNAAPSSNATNTLPSIPQSSRSDPLPVATSSSSVPSSTSGNATPIGSIDHHDDEYPHVEDDIDALIDMEEAMRNEEEAFQAEEQVATQPLDDDDCGGFFREEEPNPPESKDASTGAGTSPPAAGNLPRNQPPPPAESLEPDEPSRTFAAGCRECGNIGVQPQFQQAFGVPVCFRCQQMHPNRYALFTQTTCLSTYLLPLSSLQTLGYIEKKNPHKHAWGVMKLYWKQQVLALARARYGTRENLEEAKREKDLARIKRDDMRRRTVHEAQTRQAAFSATVASSLAELKGQTPAQVAALIAARTKGIAPVAMSRSSGAARGSRSKKRKSGAADDDDGLDEDERAIRDETPEGSFAGPSRKKAKGGPTKASSAPAAAAASAKTKTIHEHTFVENPADQSQKCSQCGFVVEFESF